MIVYQVLSSVFLLLVVPVLTGLTACQLLSIRKSLPGCYLTGCFTEWAVIQLISVPLIIFRCSFQVVVAAASVILCLFSIYGIHILIKEKPWKHRIRLRTDYSTVIVMILALAAYAWMAVSLFRLQYISRDDSRFVVYAVDIAGTNRMFLTNPSTGAATVEFMQDAHRDAVSPWAVYIAYAARITGIPVAVMAHTVLVQTLILCMACSYWLLADAFFHDNRFAVYAAVFTGILVNLFGVRNGMDVQAFAMTTIWQGKGSVAAFGIPTMFLSVVWIWQDGEGWKKYIFLYCVCFSLCLMSGMGILISGIITGTAGIAAGIVKKQISVAMKIWIGLLIPLTYYGITYLQY